MKRVKYLTMLIVALFCSATINAQGIKIYKNNGTVLDISYTKIDSIVAYGENTNNDDSHECVDLGLSVKWATCNVGADSPEEYGNYYAWGETTPKSEYTEENSKTYEKNIGDISGNPEYDAATANWGDGWRMPTEVEIRELLDSCTWTWTTQNGVEGYKVASKENSNYIFLPAAGYRRGSWLSNAGSMGCYWSSAPYESDTQSAYSLDFYSGFHGPDWCGRYFGLSVRPVTDK